jgi:hypothetical protein
MSAGSRKAVRRVALECQHQVHAGQQTTRADGTQIGPRPTHACAASARPAQQDVGGAAEQCIALYFLALCARRSAFCRETLECSLLGTLWPLQGNLQGFLSCAHVQRAAAAPASAGAPHRARRPARPGRPAGRGGRPPPRRGLAPHPAPPARSTLPAFPCCSVSRSGPCSYIKRSNRCLSQLVWTCLSPHALSPRSPETTGSRAC